MRFRLVLACLLVTALGLLGAAPVVAQDDSGSADADAGGEGVMTTEEAEALLARVKAVASAALSGEAAPPLEVVTVTRFGNQAEDLPLEFDLPSFELEGRAEVASNRDVRYTMNLVPIYGDSELTEQQRVVYETVTDLPRAMIVGGEFYWSTSLTHLQRWPPDIPEWLRLDRYSDISDQTGIERLTYLLNPSTAAEEFLTNIPGTDRFISDLIDAIDSVDTVSAVGQSNVRDNETTHLVLRIPTVQAVANYANTANEMFTAFNLLGYVLPPPSPAFMERFFDPDYRVEIDVWIDSTGLIHKVSTDLSEVFVDFFTGPFAEVIGELSESEREALLEAVRGSFEYTISTDIIFLDEDPVIEPPPASEFLAVANLDAYTREFVLPYIESLQAEAAADDGGLADTGANTPLLVIVGLSVVMAGALVFGLSRRLRDT